MDKKEIYPLRDGYKGTAPPEVLAAVRAKQTSWDGTNWIALRMHIVVALPEGARENLDTWTFSHIVQFFHNLKNTLALKLGAESDTNNWTITPASFTTIRIPTEPIGQRATATASSADETLVVASQLGEFAGIGEKVIRETLHSLDCKPWIKSKGKGNPHQWRYCDAVETLRTVKSGTLRSIDWPELATGMTTPKDSSKIPARK